MRENEEKSEKGGAWLGGGLTSSTCPCVSRRRSLPDLAAGGDD